MVLASGVVPTWQLAASLAAFFLTEVSQFALHRRLRWGGASWERPAFVANAALAATIFSAFPMLIWSSGTGTGHVMGLGMMVTAVMHCILIRSHHLGVCLASLLPLMAATALMVGPRILGHAGGLGGAPQAGWALLPAGLYCAVCAGYMIHSAIDQNREKRRMADALARAEAASRAKGRFLTSMSHEIRTPLNGILGIAQINRDAARTEEEAELAETLLSSGHILKSMVDDILDHAKIEAGRLDLHPAPMDLRHLCDAVRRLYEAGAEEKGLDLVVEVSDDVPTLIVADKLRLHQIVANLVSNAVKFTPSGEVRIAVSAAPSEDGALSVEIAVRDTGKGLSEDEASVLFQAFTQVGDEASLAAKGTGLGLVISRSLARLMEGDVAVESEPGRGSCFTLAFRAEAAEGASVGPRSHGEAPSIPRLRGMSVLLAEDNRTNRLVVRAFLRGTGVQLTEVEDGAAAVEAARGGAFDLILMDMRMPVMDGATAFEAIRALGGAAPVVALTANAMPEDRASYLARGMDGYLSKPLSKTALLRTLAGYAPSTDLAA